MRIITIIFLILFILTNDLVSQNRIIQGGIIDEDLESIPLVNIKIKDSIIGNAGFDGRFKIQVPSETDELVFLFLGMEPSTININNKCDTVELIMMFSDTYDFIPIYALEI